MPLSDMPARRERSAPSFEDSRPEELMRYFSDLEMLLDRYNVTDNHQCKQAALRYTTIQTERLWKTTEAWSDQSKSYVEFRAEIFQFYPDASGDRTYMIQDLDLAIGHYARTGIFSAADLGEYYRQFLLISHFLISKGRLSTQEQSRSFFRGFQPHFEARIRQRLQQKFIDHFPDDPYTLSDIYEAASYVLIGTSAAMIDPTLGLEPDHSFSSSISPGITIRSKCRNT